MYLTAITTLALTLVAGAGCIHATATEVSIPTSDAPAVIEARVRTRQAVTPLATYLEALPTVESNTFVRVGQTPMLVLEEVTEPVTVGHAKFIVSGDEAIMRREIDLEMVSETYAARIGESATLLSESGELCPVEIIGLTYIGYFNAVEHAGRSRSADAFWDDAARQHVYLMAELSHADCAATAVRAIATEVSRVWTSAEPSEIIASGMKVAMRQLPRYHETQATYLQAYGGDAPTTKKWEDDYLPSLQYFETDQGRFAVMTYFNSGYCEVGVSFRAVWQVTGDVSSPELSLRYQGAANGDLQSLVEANGSLNFYVDPDSQVYVNVPTDEPRDEYEEGCGC